MYIRDTNLELPVGKGEAITTRNRDRGAKDRLAASLVMREQNWKRPKTDALSKMDQLGPYFVCTD